MANKNMAEAQRLAKIAASGLTANDALPLYYLQMVAPQNQRGATNYDTFVRHSRAVEKSWKFDMLMARLVAQNDKALGRQMVEQQFMAFRKAPPAWPDVIGFYRDHGFDDQAKAMARECTFTMPSYRQACVDNSITKAEQAARAAASEKKAQKMVDKLFKKK